MYRFTNEEFTNLCEAIEKHDYITQHMCIIKAQMKKSENNEKIRKRVNKMRKTNKNYGRTPYIPRKKRA